MVKLFVDPNLATQSILLVYTVYFFILLLRSFKKIKWSMGAGGEVDMRFFSL